MNKFEILSVALEYIEENITSGVTPADCAKYCGYSLSNLQKMFRCVFNIGVSDYISRRKLTLAAGELIKTDASVLDIALRYGYNSHEVFTRAFMRLWGENPSKFRRNRSFSEIFPKFGKPGRIFDKKGNVVMNVKKQFDVSHLYDFIRERGGKYAVCFDMNQLMKINNEYGGAAGDLTIAECLRRIDEASDPSMLTMRIGGDEFVLITDFSDEKDAKAVTDVILSSNGRTVSYGGNEIGVSMRAGFVVLPEGNLRYSELFSEFIIAGDGQRNHAEE